MSDILFDFSFDSIRNQTDKFIKITMKENSGIQNSHDIILKIRFTLTDSAKTKKYSLSRSVFDKYLLLL